MFCLYNLKNSIFINYHFNINCNVFHGNFNKINFNNLYDKIINTKLFRFDKFCKKKYINFIFKLNNKYYYNFNHLNSYFLKNLLTIINKISKKNENILFFDYDYKSILPIYNYFYGCKNIQNNKSFFLLNNKFISSNNWSYFYSFFLSNFKISSLFFLDYLNFSKFFKNFSKFNLPIISIIPHNINSCYIDYYFYINYFNLESNKFFFYNFISSNIFFNNNLKWFLNKKHYLILLFKFNKIKILLNINNK